MTAIEPLRFVDPVAYAHSRWLLERRAKIVMAEHGSKAFMSTRAGVAAHEAGHVIALAATGQLPQRAWIASDRVHPCIGSQSRVKTWYGKTIFAGTSEQRIERTRSDVAVCPAALLRLGVTALAGFHGEEIYGTQDLRWGSSLDEILLAEAVCTQYAQEHHLRDQFVFDEVTSLTRCVLRSNAKAGREMAAALERKRTIGAEEIASLCRKVKPVDVGSYLSQLLHPAGSSLREVTRVHS